MGQYRQWLSYREVDQQLQGQIKEAERELVQLYAQIEQMQAATISPENRILRMLIGIQQAEQENHKRAEAHASGSISGEQGVSGRQRGSVSPALFSWSNLPNFDTQNIRRPTMDTQNQQFAPQFQAPNDNLLPQDLNTLTTDANQTDPQIQIPWWLRNAHPAKKEDQQSTQPIDQLSKRTNQYVQRWFERWGNSANESGETQEKSDQ